MFLSRLPAIKFFMHATCSGTPTSFDIIISTIPSEKHTYYESTLPEGVKRNVTVVNVAYEIRFKKNDKRKEKKRMTQTETEREVRDMSKNFTTGYIWNPFFLKT